MQVSIIFLILYLLENPLKIFLSVDFFIGLETKFMIKNDGVVCSAFIGR